MELGYSIGLTLCMRLQVANRSARVYLYESINRSICGNWHVTMQTDKRILFSLSDDAK